MHATPVLATSGKGTTHERHPFSVLELLVAAVIVFFIGWGGWWFEQNSAFTLYAFPDDPVITRLHHPQWYALRIVHYGGSKQPFAEHVGSPYATLAACQAGLEPLEKADPAHPYRCGAYRGRIY